MDYTRFTNLEVTGAIKGDGDITLGGKVAAASLAGAILGKKTFSLAADKALTTDDIATLCVGITLTAASKTVTANVAAGQVLFVINEGGTNAFTLKTATTDSGTSIAAGKVALVIGGATAADTKKYVLN